MSLIASKYKWQGEHGAPICRAQFKQQAADFIVEEDLGYSPSGDGEHVFLWIEKQDTNTAFVAEQLAKFSGLPLRNISYAGRKDKYALTRQWFGVHLGSKQELEWNKFNLDKVSILDVTRNQKKLRTGGLRGNRFEICLRDLEAFDQKALEQRLELIKKCGVLNYFGQQRFGLQHDEGAGNLLMAKRMLDGEVIRNRNKRSMIISAMRAWLFNEFIEARLLAGLSTQAIIGDALNLAGSNSFFVHDGTDQNIAQRVEDRDLLITAPMWGKGNLSTQAQALELEQECAHKYASVCLQLEALGLKQERRPIRMYPENMTWQLEDKHLRLSFQLRSGCFATSVLNELVEY